MVGYSGGILEHGEWFDGGRWSVYKERLFGVGGFPILLSLLVLLYSKASTTLTPHWFSTFLDSLNTNLKAFLPDSDITLFLPISPTSDHARYSKLVRRLQGEELYDYPSPRALVGRVAVTEHARGRRAETMYWPNLKEKPAARTTILEDDTAGKGAPELWAKWNRIKVGCGIWIW